MMGLPRSLDDAKLDREVQLQLMNGNTDIDVARDNRPTHHTVFTIDYTPLKDGVFEFDPCLPPMLLQDTISMVIPPEPKVFSQETGINYLDSNHPLAMNEVEVPDSELVAFNDSVGNVLPVYKDHFYKTAANLLAFNDAAEYVKAGLRDGLDVGIELDGALLSAFVPISRLDAIAALVEQTKMPDKYKRKYLKRMSELLADKTIDAMHKHDVGEAAREHLRMNQELQHARIRATDKTVPVNTVGVTGSRR